MSHHAKKVTIICPNCSSRATGNYCSQCGQETHLHNETFVGLVTHFVAHYFHYDSKFWQTLKTLWTRPGKLTIAYWEKQRMRYIPPISLYIFISAVFFIIASSSYSKDLETVTVTHSDTGVSYTYPAAETADKNVDETSASENEIRNSRLYINDLDEGRMDSKQFVKELYQTFPKIFFFMIPLMALILKLLFIKRKETEYVHHAVFALHYHSLFFSGMILVFLGRYAPLWIPLSITIAMTLYFVLAMRNVYKTSWLRTGFYSLVVGTLYMLFLGIISTIMVIWVATSNGHA